MFIGGIIPGSEQAATAGRSAEFLGNRVPAFKNVHVGSIVAIVLSLILVWTGFWARIWVLFGGANQLMAGLALFLVSIWLVTEGKNNQWAFWPSMFMIVTTIGALLVTAYNVFRDVATKPGLTAAVIIGNIMAGVIAVLLVVAAVILAIDGWKALRKPRKVEEAEAAKFVTLPEALPIAVIRRFINWFDEFGIPVGGVVVNMLIDSKAAGENPPEFVRNRIAMQLEYMEQIWQLFPNVRALVPLFETEVRGIAMLGRTAGYLFG